MFSNCKLQVLLLLVSLFLSATAFAAGWQQTTAPSVGWSSVGQVNAIAFDAGNSQTLYAGTASGGILKGTDDGTTISWSQINSGLASTAVSCLLVRTGVIYVGTASGGLFQWASGDIKWSAVAGSGIIPANATVKSVVVDAAGVMYVGTSISVPSTSGGLYKIANGNGSVVSDTIGSINAIVTDSTGTLFAGGSGGVFRLNPSGGTLSAVSGTTGSVIAMASDSAGTLYAGTPSGVFKLSSTVGTWSLAVGSATTGSVYSLAVDPTDNKTIYAGVGKGVFKSIDSGTNWTATQVTSDVTPIPVRSFAIHRTTPQTVYAGTTTAGIFKTTSGGINLNPSPTITSPANTTFNIGTTASFSFAASGTPSPAITLSGNLPSGVTFNQTTGLLSGTPATGTAGIYNLTVTASNGLLPNATQNFVLTVSLPPSIAFTSPGTTLFTVGSQGNFTVAATSSSTPSITKTSGTLPTGISFNNATRILSGNPVSGTAGSYNLVFKATSGTLSTTQNFTLVVRDEVVDSQAWHAIGPFAGNTQSLVVDRSNGQNLYATADSGGVYKSTNGGASWSVSSNGISSNWWIRVLSMDPTNSQIIYAGSWGRIYKTTNGGTSWSAYTIGLPSCDVWSIAVDPNNNQILYAGTDRNGVYKSLDGGASWTAATTNVAYTGWTTSITVDPSNSQTVYAWVSASGLYKTTDGGAHWARVYQRDGSDGQSANMIAIKPSDSQTIYLATSGGIFKTVNGGTSWSKEVSDNSGTAVAYDPNDNRIIYIASGGKLIKSTDNGNSWISFTTGFPTNATLSLAIDFTNSQTLYIGTLQNVVYKSVNGGTSWAPSSNGLTTIKTSAIVIDPSNSQTIYTGSDSGVYKSANGGLAWSALTNNGLTNSVITSLAIDMSNSQTVYAGTQGGGVFKTTNGGTSWIAVNSGLTFYTSFTDATFRNPSVTAIVVNPSESQILYAGTFDRFFASSGQYVRDGGSIYKSTDGGASWTESGSGLSEITGNRPVACLAVDSNNSQVIYAGTAGGLYKTTNGGTTWSLLNSAIADATQYAIAIDPTNSQIVYALITQKIYKSTDGGVTWNVISQYGGKALIIDQTNTNVLYAGATGIVKSVDGGMTWIKTQAQTIEVRAFAIDPANSQNIYAGTFGNGIYKTMFSGSVPAITGNTTPVFMEGTSGSFQLTSSGWPLPVFTVYGALPNGITFDNKTGAFSGTPPSATAGSYPVIITASNGLPPDAVRGFSLTVLSPTPLTLSIASPANNAKVASLTGISGTASGSISGVELQVSDGFYYLQSDGKFAVTPTWLTATGTTSWTLNTGSVAWLEGVKYTVSARGIDSSNNRTSPVVANFTIQVPSSKKNTILTLDFTPKTIRAGESIVISGNLARNDTTSAAGQPVRLIVTLPSSSINPNPEPQKFDYITDSIGNFSSGALNIFTSTGVYIVQARYDGADTLAASSTFQVLAVTPHSGYAIIVTGKATDNSLIDMHTASTDSSYDILTKKRGFLADNIKYLKSTTSAAVTKQQLQDAITTWAKDKIISAAAPLYLFMIDHGISEGFVLGDVTLTPDDLNNWITTLENDLATLAPDALASYNRFIINGSCYSGAFFKKLSKPGRVIITSSASNERSIAGYPIYSSASNTTFSGGEYFFDSMFNFLGRGDSFRDAFVSSSSMVALRDPRKVVLGEHSGVIDTLAQHPLLDDNGDTISSYSLDGSPDGALAASLSLGVGKRSIGNPADITAVTATTTLETDDAAAKTLWLKVGDNSRVAKAWLEIRTPNTTVTGTDKTSGQVIPSLVNLPLYYDGYQWQNEYAFTVSGTYDILYYTQDNQTGDISPTAHSVVYKKMSGNPAPAAFNLLSPVDSSGQSTMFTLAWEEVSSTSDNPLTYTLLVSTDQNFGTVVYKEEGIPQATTYIAEGKLKNPANGLYYCQDNNNSWCWWKIQAVDKYGAKTESNVRRFNVVLTNGLPGIIKGFIRNGVTGQPISGAAISVNNAAVATSLANGAYLFSTSPGTIIVTAGKNSYPSKTAALSIGAGVVSQQSFALGTPTYTVTFMSGGNGTVNGTTSQTLNEGENSSIVSAVPSTGFYFVNWTGTGGFVATTANPLTLSNVTANMTITANFSLNPVNGSCGGSSGQTLTAIPTGSSNLCASGTASNISTGASSWNWTCLGTNGGTTANCSASIQAYTTTASVTGGNGTVTCTSPVNSGTTSTCTVTPTTGYQLATFTDNSVDKKASVTGGSYSIANVTANHTITATFSLIPVNGTCGSSDKGTFTTAPATGICSTGTATTITGTGPWNWTCDGSNGGTTATCTASKSAPTKPGDCDNSGTVTIAEVQSAINMFLGLKTVDACVDIDSSGSVSIAEVQKVINSFLGL